MSVQATVVERETFETSDAAQYFDPKTLQTMVGQPRHRFPDVIVKELIDNALDAAEKASRPPEVNITTTVYRGNRDGWYEPSFYKVTVEDNGPGIPEQTIDRIANFSGFVSDKELYRAPTRGQQGNALKTVLGIPYALGVTDSVLIVTQDGTHAITPRLDPAGELIVDHVRRDWNRRLNGEGTAVTVTVTLPTMPDLDRWARDFALVNPHATITSTTRIYRGDRPDETVSYKPTVDGGWSKPKPTDPTSPWWYDSDAFVRLVFAHIRKWQDRGGRDKPLGVFVREFAGLTSTVKAKDVAQYFPRVAHLSDFDDRPDEVRRLHQRMLDATKKPNHAALGRVPEDHYRQQFEQLYGVERFWFSRREDDEAGINWVIEVATAETKRPGALTFAVNYSPTFEDPTGRLHIAAGDKRGQITGLGVTSLLRQTDMLPDGRLNRAVAIHLISPAPQFTDKGKTTLAVGDGTR